MADVTGANPSLPVVKDKSSPSPAALIECLRTFDVGSSGGRKELWRALTHMDSRYGRIFKEGRDRYFEKGFKPGTANRQSAVDIIESLSPDGIVDPALLEDLPLVSDPPKGLPDTKETRFDRLMADVREASRGARCGIGPSVIWVSANLRTRMESIVVDEVPGIEALSLWLWASQNETEYRRLYDSKRIPSRGIAEDDKHGFIDSGEAIESIMSRIRDGMKIAD